MKVAVAQIACIPGDTSANLSQMTQAVEHASERGAEMIVLPEMADTGYVMADILRTASPWEAGAGPRLCELAARLNISIICGLSRRCDSGVFNTAVMIDRHGSVIDEYRKTHLFSASPVEEHRHLQQGNRLTMAELNGWKIGVLVCYDIRFPEAARTLALAGAEAIIVPSAFPYPRLRHWEILTASRAIENQIWVITANRCGTDGGLTFCGSSAIIDPFGVRRASASDAGPDFLLGEIDRQTLERTRSGIAVFRDRREELYDVEALRPS